jgi:hypothetical protein
MQGNELALVAVVCSSSLFSCPLCIVSSFPPSLDAVAPVARRIAIATPQILEFEQQPVLDALPSTLG